MPRMRSGGRSATPASTPGPPRPAGAARRGPPTSPAAGGSTPPAPPPAAAAGGRYAARPADIPGRGWLDILRRLRRALARDHIWLASAGVAYCFLLAAIPGLVVLVALLGLLVGPA